MTNKRTETISFESPKEEQCCGNCHFFFPTTNREKNQGEEIGYCRANPPQPYYEITDDLHVVPKIGRFPVVLGNIWCGMWDRR